MDSVASSPVAFMVPITAPSPLSWARLVAKRIISPDPSAPPHRIAHIEAFSEKVAETIEPFFRNPAKSKAIQAAKAIRECFLNSEWRSLAADPNRQLEVRFILETTLREAQEPFFRCR